MERYIPNAPGYKVSEYGKLLSNRNYKAFLNPNGYAYVTINKFGLRTTVHNLVAGLWIGEKPIGKQINCRIF